ncbi:HEAT repeat domain-containing protein, partial [Streptomyces cyaneofuscatus]|uniref:HEAT repeat domain-containing protein n=1 Tax=Streptomyces cyaneofuscatus TaxID=66883 RepID=UPI0034092231
LHATTADEDAGVRRVALVALGKWWHDRPEVFDAVLHATTADEDAGVRRVALVALGKWWHDRPEVFDTVLHATTTDDNPDTRRVALVALGERWHDRPEVFDIVLHATTDDDPDIRQAAVRVLAHCYTDRACRVLIELAAGEGDDVLRIDLVRVIALVWPDEPGVLQVLEDTAAKDTSDVVRTTARQGLAFLQLRSSLSTEQGAPAAD